MTTTRTATFGAGCFWGVESAFRRVDGVLETAVGYAGGSTDNPNYADVCSGTTGHAEVVQVEFDPAKVRYEDLLEIFWSVHDPTVPEKAQYRSVIFAHDDAQHDAARAAIREREAGGHHRRPLVTAVEPAPVFHRAEEYHQQFLERRGVA